jgi:acyl dehydratase
MTTDDIQLLLGTRHVLAQRKVLGALLGVARSALRPRRRPSAAPGLTLPGPEVTAAATAPPLSLVRDYARAMGAAADAYRHPPTVPAHLFPQWTFPVAARALQGLPFPLARLLNAGCRLQVNAPLPAGAALTVRAQLLDVQADARRALLHQRIVTDGPDMPGALVADLYAVAPLSRGKAAGPGVRQDVRVPHGVREVARLRVGPRAGLAYAFLTGDFNPVHWVSAYARASGFSAPILHGFALLGWTVEALGRALFAGATDRIRVIDVKFKRALVLGSDVTVGLYLGERHLDDDHRDIYVADAPGVRPYLMGTFATKETHA